MGEAIITRAGGGSGGSSGGGEFSPDPSLCKILVTLINPDGSAVDNGKVRYADSDGGNYTYSTNANGKCLITTNKSSGYIHTDEEYEDINSANISVSTPLGEVIKKNITRTLQTSGYSIKKTTNCNVKFSPLLKSIDVELYGGGGGGYSGDTRVNFEGQTDSTTGQLSRGPRFSEYRHDQSEYYGGNGYTNKSTITISPDNNYSIIIGKGGSGGTNTYLYGKRVSLGYSFDYRASCSGVEGSTGGTSSFGGILSAVGGAGCDRSANGVGGSGMAGGHGSSGSYGSGGYSSGSGSYGTIYIWCNAYGSDGQTGYCNISNFKYK